MKSMPWKSVISDNDWESIILLQGMRYYINQKRSSSLRDEYLSLSLLFNDMLAIDSTLTFLPKQMTAFLRNLLVHFNTEASDDNIRKNLHLAFLWMLDSYFDYIGPFKTRLKQVTFQIFYLPRLALAFSLEPTETDVEIEKLENQQLVINGKNFSCYPTKFILFERIKFLLTSQKHYAFLFSYINPSYLTSVSSNQPQRFEYEKLQKALLSIAIAYPDLSELILKSIEFFVPLKSDDDFSLSFTVKPYLGVIFLSYDTDVLDIAENIIREFCNNMMYLYLKRGCLVENDELNLFTPYSQKPSSPIGLLRHIFIFIEVCQFFTYCLLNEAFEEHQSLLKYRMTVQLYRMQLAFNQLEKVNLALPGKKFLGLLQKRYQQLLHANENKILEKPDIIDKHITLWNKNNPEYVVKPLPELCK